MLFQSYPKEYRNRPSIATLGSWVLPVSFISFRLLHFGGKIGGFVNTGMYRTKNFLDRTMCDRSTGKRFWSPSPMPKWACGINIM